MNIFTAVSDYSGFLCVCRGGKGYGLRLARR